ncbi:putative ammonium transporter sll1017 [Oscarella lobularis]|uniref:putative ammonium transporter sll1017 n=1 Tax=Oscarella lobularis TaxID=121494 RepID=UPI003313E028
MTTAIGLSEKVRRVFSKPLKARYVKMQHIESSNTCTSDAVHINYRYSDASASWVLVASILIFFMKAGFMLMESSFVMDRSDRRSVILFKYLDTCASAIGFFVVGYSLSQGDRPYPLMDSSDTVQFFFKFTFASNTATIIGGTLCGQSRKMRAIAIPIYAFMISGFIHPMVARWVWGGSANATTFLGPAFLSPYRKLFCRNNSYDGINITHLYETENNMYAVDFAGGGAVHLLGGIAGLMLLLVLKLDNVLRKKDIEKRQRARFTLNEGREQPSKPDRFLDWMYPEHGGGDLYIEDSALGVLILWTSWFAFNCGSTESVESATTTARSASAHEQYALMFYDVPGRIAINMILCTGSAGLVAVCIAGYAQLRLRSRSTNVNEIANGILGALVAITSGCPFVTPQWAIGIGIIAVLFYHFGCWIEYRFNLDDTARVFPVHGMCGFWSMMAPGILINDDFVNQTYGGLRYCYLCLPPVTQAQRFGYQLLGSVVIAVWSALACGVLFLILNFIPVQKIVTLMSKCLCIYKGRSPQEPDLIFKRGLLFTCPDEYVDHVDPDEQILADGVAAAAEARPLLSPQGNDGSAPSPSLPRPLPEQKSDKSSVPLRRSLNSSYKSTQAPAKNLTATTTVTTM